ncbi:RICIN domain-containing protein [Streptomyces sp. NPDC052101]|uniref:RICIN domain-containing protein n=1 Tax=Streptomyces sp. NPDC052101 TaxID=3155763 RepID=UPI003419CF0B
MRFLNVPLAVASAGVLGLLALGAPAAHAQENRPGAQSDSGYSVLSNDSSPQQVLDAYGFGTISGTPVVTWAANGGINQRWSLADQPDETVAIVGAQSGKCVAPSGSHGALMLQDCTAVQFGQRWYKERRPGGRIIFENALFEGQCLDMAGSYSQAVIRDCNGSASQNWRLFAS